MKIFLIVTLFFILNVSYANDNTFLNLFYHELQSKVDSHELSVEQANKFYGAAVSYPFDDNWEGTEEQIDDFTNFVFLKGIDGVEKGIIRDVAVGVITDIVVHVIHECAEIARNNQREIGQNITRGFHPGM